MWASVQPVCIAGHCDLALQTKNRITQFYDAKINAIYRNCVFIFLPLLLASLVPFDAGLKLLHYGGALIS